MVLVCIDSDVLCARRPESGLCEDGEDKAMASIINLKEHHCPQVSVHARAPNTSKHIKHVQHIRRNTHTLLECARACVPESEA
eukprot:2646590-Rhodomonas_salina.1